MKTLKYFLLMFLILVVLVGASCKRGGGGGRYTEILDPDPTVSDITLGATEINENTSTSASVTASDVDANNAPYAVTYAWTATAGTFSDATVASTTYNAPADVTADTAVTITVEVTGSSNAKVTKTATLTVKNVPNVAPVAVPAITTAEVPGGGYAIGTDTTAVANATDADGDPITYAWTLSDSGVVVSGDTAATFVFQFGTPGNKTVGLTVTDDKGASNTYTLTPVFVVYFPLPDVIWMSKEEGATPDKVVVTVWAWQVTDAFEVDCPITFDVANLKTSPPPSLDSDVGSKANDPEGLWEDTRVDLSIGGFLPPNTYDIAIAAQGVNAGNVAQGLKSGKVCAVTFTAVAGATGDVVFAFDISPSPQGVAKTRYVDVTQTFVEFTGGAFGVTYTLP